MHGPFAPHIRLTDADRLGGAPRVRLSMEAPPRASTTCPYHIRFTLQREDDDPRSCLVHWDPNMDGFVYANIVLLRCINGVNGGGGGGGGPTLEKLDIGPDPRYAEAQRHLTKVFWSSCSGFQELAPGGRCQLTCNMGELYHKALVAGESYELLWPGCEAVAWAWGTMQENWEQEVRTSSGGVRWPGMEVVGDLPRLVIPGGSRLTFKAEKEAVSWPGRAEHEARWGFGSANQAELYWQSEQALKRLAPDFVRVSEREYVIPPDISQTVANSDNVLCNRPEAPILVRRLDCPPTLTLNSSVVGSDTFKVRATITYNAPESNKPITFHTYDLNPNRLFPRSQREGYALYKHHDLDQSSDEQEWQISYLDEDDMGSYAVFDAPDIQIHVREDADFVSLYPGEVWTATYELQTPHIIYLPSDAKVGDRFRYQFRGVLDVD